MDDERTWIAHLCSINKYNAHKHTTHVDDVMPLGDGFHCIDSRYHPRRVPWALLETINVYSTNVIKIDISQIQHVLVDSLEQYTTP